MAEGTQPAEGVVYVGNKTPMHYVLAALIQFNRGSNTVVLKARGRAISRAVDVAEILKNQFLPGQLEDQVKIGTERVGEGDQARNISIIEITLTKKA